MAPRRAAPRAARLLALAVWLGLAGAQSDYGWSAADEVNTADDPWTPCERVEGGDANGIGGTQVRGFCRLSCTARFSYAPRQLDCEMLDYNKLLARSHSRGNTLYRKMSQDSFSKVNSGVSQLGSNDPDVG